MLFNFKYDKNTKKPKMKLCYMNKKVIGYMNNLFNLKISPTFLDISPMSFTMKPDNKHFDIIKKHLLIHVDGMGYFVVKQVSCSNNGLEDEISVSCESYESTLNDISVSFENKTYMIYDAIEPEKTLLGMISNACRWTINHVDASLMATGMGRTFDGLDNIQIYNLLMTNMSNAYKCYFIFDTENKTISAYSRDANDIKTNVAFTFDNLLKNVEINQNQDDIITQMYVSGTDGVGINNVNPIGDSCLYDFTYYMNNDYGMSNGLISALTAWNTKVENARDNYSELVLQRQTLSAEILTKQSELSVLQSEYKGVQEARSTVVSSTMSDEDKQERLDTLYSQEQTVNINIAAKQSEINTLQTTYNNVKTSLQTISDSLAFNNTDNFTASEQEELKNFIISGASYTNENFIYTSETTESQKIEISKQLIAEAEKTFKKLSNPCYEFSIDIINYLYMPEFEKFVNDTNLGVLMNVKINSNTWVQPRLLKIELDYDNLDSTKFVFGDTLRLIDDIHVFEDTYNAVTKTSNKVAVTAGSWDEPKKNGFYDTVKNYMTESLSLSQQEIMNSENQEVMIGSYGIICRKFNSETGTYELHEMRINNNVICFSPDNFQHVKTALGYLKFGGNDYYGLNAEVLIGNLLIGNELLISNSNNTFKVNGGGATLINANMSIENEINRILLSPTSGIKIQKKDPLSPIWQDKFYTDTNGDIRAYGITLQESNIAGWTTTSVAFTSPTGDFIGSNGYGQLSLMSWTPTSATFNGNIYANNLMSNNDVGGQNIFVDGTMGGGWLTNSSVDYGKLSDLCVNSLRANLVTTNYLTANYITAGDIQSNFATINELQTNYATINSVQANYATIGNLDAALGRIGTLETDSITANTLATRYLITDDGVFKGKTYIGSEQNNSCIESILTVISANITAYQLHINSTGGVNLYGGKGGIYLDAGDDEGENENPVVLNKLTVSGTSQFNGNITGDAVFSEDIYLNGTVKVIKNGTEYNGITQSVTVAVGTTLDIKNGVIVNVT